MFNLNGTTAIITGAANGIGKASTELFLAAGANVVAADLNSAELNANHTASDQLRLVTADVADSAAGTLLASAADEAFGGVDILLNNAGICIADEFENLTEAQWDSIMAVNAKSIFTISQAVLPQLKQSGRGRIINVGSIMSDLGGPSLSIYGASKHLVAGLTKGMAVDLGKFQITVNYLQPGSIVTKLSEPFMDDPDFKAYWENKAPIGRLGQASEVASAALFLASEEARFVSGTGLNVDGGAIVNF